MLCYIKTWNEADKQLYAGFDIHVETDTGLFTASAFGATLTAETCPQLEVLLQAAVDRFTTAEGGTPAMEFYVFSDWADDEEASVRVIAKSVEILTHGRDTLGQACWYGVEADLDGLALRVFREEDAARLIVSGEEARARVAQFRSELRLLTEAFERDMTHFRWKPPTT